MHVPPFWQPNAVPFTCLQALILISHFGPWNTSALCYAVQLCLMYEEFGMYVRVVDTLELVRTLVACIVTGGLSYIVFTSRNYTIYYYRLIAS